MRADAIIFFVISLRHGSNLGNGTGIFYFILFPRVSCRVFSQWVWNRMKRGKVSYLCEK